MKRTEGEKATRIRIYALVTTRAKLAPATTAATISAAATTAFLLWARMGETSVQVVPRVSDGVEKPTARRVVPAS